MRRRKGVLPVLAIALLSVGLMGAKYAVLVSPHWVYWDNLAGYSDYWYSLFFAYEALIDHGYSHNNTTVLYHNGDDFVSKYHRFRNRWSCDVGKITDRAFSDTLFEHVLDSLGDGVVGSDDTLLVWWVCGHGDNSVLGSGGDSCVDRYFARWNRHIYQGGDTVTLNGRIPDTTIARYLDLVDHYALKVVLWSTCNTGKLLDSLTPTDSTIALGAVQWHHYLVSVVDTMQGGGYPEPDTVGISAFTMYVADLMNRHGLRGETYDGDANADGLVEASEFVYLIDSMYRRDPYLVHDDYADTDTPVCAGATALTYDSVQLLDPGAMASSLVLAPKRSTRHLAFKYRGTVKGRFTDAGYLHLAGTGSAGTVAGLRFGGNTALDTNGNFVWWDTLLTHSARWLDSTGDLSGGLKVSSPCAKAVFHVDAVDTVRTRAWIVEQHPELK